MGSETCYSLTGFLALYRALRNSKRLDGDDRKRLDAMGQVMGALRPEEREALESRQDDSATRRHRERALLRLRSELAARGMLGG